MERCRARVWPPLTPAPLAERGNRNLSNTSAALDNLSSPGTKPAAGSSVCHSHLVDLGVTVMIKVLAALLAFGIVFGAAPRAVDACAGLIGSNGAVNLGRTTTLAAYHDGVEHYV